MLIAFQRRSQGGADGTVVAGGELSTEMRRRMWVGKSVEKTSIAAPLFL